MSGLTRRRLLGTAAAGGAIGAAASILPQNVQAALANPPKRRGSMRDIKHVVMLMQENRSFDHYFGTLSGVRGFGDPHAAKLPTGKSVFHQPDPAGAGELLPFHLDTRTTNAQALPSTDHGWVPQHSSWNNGKMDNWLPAHRLADGDDVGPYVMGYLTRDDIPFQYALADAFTILDAYHCSVLGPTGPNRHMWMAGTIDPNGLAGGPSLTTSAPNGQYSFKTYPERLTEAGVSWQIYHEEGGTTGLAAIQHIKQYNDAKPGDDLYEKAMKPRTAGQFEYDVMTGNLPTVSWILPPSNMDEHPANTPASGAAYVAGKLDALAANPEIWNSTVFILSYDENDGLFDHVIPPTPPQGTKDEFVFKTSVTGEVGGGLPTGLGFRVPCIVVSPWTAGGWVSSEISDHTSQLRFLERLTGVKEPNITDWRRRTVGDLTSAFRFDDGIDEPPVLPDTQGQLNLSKYEVAHLPAPAVPTTNQHVPSQEKGHRPHVD